MKKLLFILMMLPVAVFGQNEKYYMSDLAIGHLHAVRSVFNDLPKINNTRYIIFGGDTIWEKNNYDMFLFATMYKAYTINSVTSILDVPFGSSNKFARNTLKKKYGRPDYSDRGKMIFENVTYDEETYDIIYFGFKVEKHKEFFNQAVFIKKSKTWDEAVEIKDSIQQRMSRRFTSIKKFDDMQTVGGLAPITFLTDANVKELKTFCDVGFGFLLEIVEDKDPKYPYYVRLMYGPYNINFQR